jgi:hypothetical protein
MTTTAFKRFSGARHLRRVLTVVVVALLSAAMLAPLASPAQAASTRTDLRVLVVTNGDPSADAIATQLTQEGVPHTTVDLSNTGRPTITDAFLQNAATQEGFFQAVVLPSQAPAGLSAAELDALAGYEAAYGVRQVDAYNYPGASMGLQSPAFAGTLDGSTATVTADGLSGPFSYLKGSLPIDDFDPAVGEVFGYLATPAPCPPGRASPRS